MTEPNLVRSRSYGVLVRCVVDKLNCGRVSRPVAILFVGQSPETLSGELPDSFDQRGPRRMVSVCADVTDAVRCVQVRRDTADEFGGVV